MIHENFSLFKKVTPGSDRNFCLTFSFVLALISLYFNYYHNSVKPWAIGISITFLLIAITKPQIMKPLNRIWIGIGAGLGIITTPVIMGILYFSVFSFIAIIAKIFRKNF